MKKHHNARYPFLWYRTSEEERIIRENRAEFGEDVQFFSWDIDAGFQAMIENGDGGWVWQSVDLVESKSPQGNDPLKALKAVRALSDDSIVFMKDFHEYFKKISVIRTALNLKEDLKRRGITICFLSSASSIPIELQNDITPMDYPYPTEEALEKILVKFAEDNGEHVDDNSKNKLVDAMKGLTWEGAENSLALSLATEGKFNIRTILDQKASQLKAGGGILEYGKYTETLEDLYGLERLKRFGTGILGNPKARGILITGAPGCGKSAIAKAFANYAGYPCLILRFSALKDRYQGVAESRLREAFKTIRAFGKVVVFIDEIESIATGISSGGDSGVGMTLFKETLIEMEDNRGTGAFWIGTSNDLQPLIEVSGGAMLRRFNATFFTDMPDEKEARGIANIWSKKEDVEIPGNFDLDGYTGANIAQLAETMSMLNCSAEEASEYILPYGKAYPDELNKIRSNAQEVCIWASENKNTPKSKPNLRTVKRG